MYLSITGEEEEATGWSDAEPTRQRQFLHLTGPSTNISELETNLFKTDRSVWWFCSSLSLAVEVVQVVLQEQRMVQAKF